MICWYTTPTPRKMRLRHIRDGRELPVILEDNHYDFNFQASRVPPRETRVSIAQCTAKLRTSWHL